MLSMDSRAPLRASGKVDDQLAFAHAHDATRQGGAPRFLEAFGAHQFRKARNFFFDHGARGLRSHIARAHARAARCHDGVAVVRIGKGFQSLPDGVEIVREDFNSGHLPSARRGLPIPSFFITFRLFWILPSRA